MNNGRAFRRFGALWFIALLAALSPFLTETAAAVPAADLERGFAQPPDAAKPGVYWMWENGNVTKEGITADLEAFQRVGISCVILFTDETYKNPPAQVPDGPVVRFMQPEWWDVLKHCAAEAGRLGLTIEFQNCPGENGNGGPWVTPEYSMQRVVSSERIIAGSARITETLDQPPTAENFYRDIAVLAIQLPPGQKKGLRASFPKVTSTIDGFDAAKVLDGNLVTGATLNLAANAGPQTVDFVFAEPYSAREFSLYGDPSGNVFMAEVQYSDDGLAFKSAGKFNAGGFNLRQAVMSFPPVTARHFRIAFDGCSNFLDAKATRFRITVNEIDLSPDVHLDNWGDKAGMGDGTHVDPYTRSLAPEMEPLRRADIIDVTKYFHPAESRLEWEAPAGQWLLLRVGHTSTGEKVHLCTDESVGLQCDKMSREAMDLHWKNMPMKVLDATGGRNSAIRFMHVDSSEFGPLNWTPRFREEFQKRRGYDLLPWLPVLATGRVVGSVEESERFLWDFRRTKSELIADVYGGYFQELCRKQGVRFDLEPYGSGGYDTLAVGRRCDVPMSEFWAGGGDEKWADTSKLVTWSAHLSGAPVVQCETFTSWRGGSYDEHPYSLKARADRLLTLGINRICFAVLAHQPWMNRVPGVLAAGTGTEVVRTQTWWEQSRAWNDYLARSQYLLQQGNFVADLCLMIKDQSPVEGHFNSLPNVWAPPHYAILTERGDFTGNVFSDQSVDDAWKKTAAIPGGYDLDGCDAETVIRDMTVENGRLVTPSGLNVRLLLLPQSRYMRPELLRKLRELVAAGAHVVGPRPEQSPSLSGNPACDAEVRRLAAEIWGHCDGKRVTENRLGKGLVYWGRPLTDILKDLNIRPGFQYEAINRGALLRYIHRRTDEADIYFVANGKDRAEEAQCTFQVHGRMPELWHPDTGLVEEAAAFAMSDTETTLPLRLDPSGSVFVVFRQPTSETRRIAPAMPAPEELMRLEGPWEIRFQQGRGAPAMAQFGRLISWPEHTDAGIRYFSGTATYSRSFDLPPGVPATGQKLMLDLGRVEVIGEVKLNGKDLGILWKPPFRADLTSAAQVGRNELEVRVTNLWPNRMIGDEQLPDDIKRNQFGSITAATWPDWVYSKQPNPFGRITFTTKRVYTKDSPLLPSGLLGPVELFIEGGRK